MTINELRKKFIEYFVSNGHVEISGKSLIPENDPSALFTMAGMHPLVPNLLGEPHPEGSRLVNYQKCIRTGDIEEVGDPSHLTFFEMLGYWSLGDYFKEGAIKLSYEFITSPEWMGLDADSLSVTVFEGDDLVPPDEQSAEVWKSLGLPEERIYFLPKSDNWWSTGSGSGPCGPDTEMFIDTGIEACGDSCQPGCHCGKYFEIGNDVFIQYNQKADGSYEPLERTCVDFGMGIERTAAMLQGKKSVYETEGFVSILRAIEQVSGATFGADPELDKSMRIVADHVRASVFILGDDRGVTPSNLQQGYILRRLIRRAIRHGRKLAIEGNWLSVVAQPIFDMYADSYPELIRNKDSVLAELKAEEERFLKTLLRGEQEFSKLVPNLLKNPKKEMPGRLAFKLYDTYGFPVEITQELAAEHGLTVDVEGFEKAFEKHQELSKQGAEKSFKGGLADHSVLTTRLHTATHLLHKALHEVLGDHVEQKGSNITPERLRFDFVHPEKMTEGEIEKVEQIVNDAISEDLPVSVDVMTINSAREAGAFAFFSDRYDEQVKVYSIGDFSKEVCGGPHVDKTGELGKFKIVKEQSSSAGIRRIRAVLGAD